MLKLLSRFFTSKKDKDLSELWPIVDQVKSFEPALRQLSDTELRQKTDEFRKALADHVADISRALEQNREQVQQAIAQQQIDRLKGLFDEADRLKKQRNQGLNEMLTHLMPEAFAVVKETCRRLAENGQLVVEATDWDRELAARKKHIRIEGDRAIWSNRWQVTDHEITWDMVHYDVQLIGGAVLHQGKIAEMATGEGKTLVSTLPAYLNALTGLGVHLVTVNDYLARRDSEWNGPIFEFHGLRVDCIDVHPPNSDARRRAYAADIVYGTNNEYGFDYLRDNMVTHPEHLCQRELFYAIVDEIDSVLIDEARTPLIISGPVAQQGDDEKQFRELNPRIQSLYRAQLTLVNNLLNEAKKLIAEGKDNEKEGGLQLFRAFKGLPKHNPLIKYLSEPGIKQILLKTEAYYLQDKEKNMHLAVDELYFTIDEKNNQIELTEKGREHLARAGEDPDLFLLPDITSALSELEGDPSLPPNERLARKEALVRDYAQKSELLHSIQQLLKAYTLFERDVDYIVNEGKVMIVDENTGRVLPGRRYSDGLHQAIEAKENVKIEESTQTYATVTLQNFFRMYFKLSGMTGTAETEANEFYQIYKLDVVVVPTNKPIARIDADDLIFRTKREKYNAIIQEIEKMRLAGRPTLVGTTSVEVSELLSRMLRQYYRSQNIPVYDYKKGKENPEGAVVLNVLNAKENAREAEIVAQAGQAGAITIATNMAGRGTDIKLGPGVREAGGLAIIGSERHDSRRIDRQLRGRAGRQGDPGSSQFFISLEDDLMRLFGSDRMAKVMDFMKIKEGEVIQHPVITRSIGNAQKKVEENNFAMRKRLLEYDDVMNMQREVIYSRRRNALFGDRVKNDIDNMLADLCEQIVDRNWNQRDIDNLRLEAIRYLGYDLEITEHDLDKLNARQVVEKLFHGTREQYQRKQNAIAQAVAEHMREVRAANSQYKLVEIVMTDNVRMLRMHLDIDRLIETNGQYLIDEFEKHVCLGIIDEQWKNHLREMDELKQSVQTATIEQKDPLLIYKHEAYELFKNMLIDTYQQILSMLTKAQIAQQHEEARPQAPPQRDDFSRMKAQHSDTPWKPRSQRGEQPLPVAASSDEQAPQRPLSRRERRELERQQAKGKAIRR